MLTTHQVHVALAGEGGGKVSGHLHANDEHRLSLQSMPDDEFLVGQDCGT